MKQINNVIDFLESLNKVGRIYIIVAFYNSNIKCMNIHKDTGQMSGMNHYTHRHYSVMHSS